MFNVSNYYEQSRVLYAENSFQIMILNAADTSTMIREISKICILVGVVSSVASVVLGFDPNNPVNFTAFFGLLWVVSYLGARKFEPEAQNMIKHFKQISTERRY